MAFAHGFVSVVSGHDRHATPTADLLACDIPALHVSLAHLGNHC
jgi:hypothetical protein